MTHNDVNSHHGVQYTSVLVLSLEWMNPDEFSLYRLRKTDHSVIVEICGSSELLQK